jgi:hypothetical protein
MLCEDTKVSEVYAASIFRMTFERMVPYHITARLYNPEDLDMKPSP